IQRLLDLGGAHRGRGTAALRALVDDLAPDDEALEYTAYVIRQLAELEGDSYRAWAAEALHRLAVGPRVDPADRRLAAIRLAEFGRPQTARAIEVLYALAGDPAATHSTRTSTSSDLAYLDPEPPDRTTALLEALIHDPVASDDDRCNTARDL